tara:strand:- start:2681 stop:2860 length:180 start_codon:yes stop_codon:yes gene_type:complete
LGGQLRSEKVSLMGHINYANYQEADFCKILYDNIIFGNSGFNLQAGPQLTYNLRGFFLL